VVGDGLGGRNQELALSAAIELSGTKRAALLSIATDGIDGPTPAAGAIITGDSLAQGHISLDAALAALLDNDSHPLLRSIGATVEFGLTGTNVNDLVLSTIYLLES
jgi:hydroxypyruvate reductase